MRRPYCGGVCLNPNLPPKTDRLEFSSASLGVLCSSALKGSSRRGLSLVEIIIAVVVFGICMVPTIGLFDLGYESATFSEDRIYAETLASRVLEVWNGKSYDELAGLDGKPQTDVVQRIFNTDKDQDWFSALPEYARNMGINQDYFKGALEIRQVTPGLLSLEAAISWTVLEGGKKGETRQFRLLTFRAREDLSVDSREGDTLDK